jgi:hypothetical protein
MRQFLLVTGAVIGNFLLWALFTKLPVHVMIIFALVCASGCLMLWVIVHFGRTTADSSSTSNNKSE